MKIISHRGYWEREAEKNSDKAFRRALSHGFGIETDLRDFGKKVVISHDSPDFSAMPFNDFLDLYQALSDGHEVLALNIKADGLQERILTSLNEHDVSGYFFFDMSIPDALEFQRKDMKFFTRQSELEQNPNLYESATGVWMDCFFDDWIREDHIRAHLDAGKQVCVCSPELHRRDPAAFWNRMMHMKLSQDPRVMLCTDEPRKAQAFFN